MAADGYTQAIREQSGLVTETANAKVVAGVLEAQSRTVEVEVGGWSEDVIHPRLVLLRTPNTQWFTALSGNSVTQTRF